MKLILTFYLIQYIQSIMISTCNQYVINETFYIGFFSILSIGNPVYILNLQPISIRTSDISRTQ